MGSLEAGPARKLFAPGQIQASGMDFDVSADGQNSLVADSVSLTKLPPLTLVQNWTEALRKSI